MEARDPSPASAEEDGSLSATDALAKEAAVLFQSRRYSECIDVLKQLLRKKEDDPKVIHNIAVAEYFCDSNSGSVDPKKLLDIFDKVKKRSEDLARASREQADSTNGTGGNANLGSRASSIVLQQLAASNSSISTYADEFDTSIVTLNIAVILYHLHESSHASSVLEPLYQNIEPVDETTALHICFLLLDIALASQDADKAADVIQYLEKSFGVASTVNQADNGSILSQQQLTNQLKVVAKSSAYLEASASDQSTGGAAAAVPMEDNLTRTGSSNIPDEEYDNLYTTLDSGTQNFGRPFMNDHLSKTSAADLSANAKADLKVKLQLYKVRLLLLTRNLKVAKRELKLAMNMARGRDSSTELLLKSQLEYARGNHRKAVKLLSAPPGNRTEPAMSAMFFNNLGCILHQQGSHHTASWFFSKALRESSAVLRSKSPLRLIFSSHDKSHLIPYNCGLQHLTCGNPVIAARCFREAIPLFCNQALFWLRFAECTLLALEKGVLSSTGGTSCYGETTEVQVVGSGIWRRLVVRPSFKTSNGNGKYNCNVGDGVKTADEMRDLLSLPFARQCLLNAQLLLDDICQRQQKRINDNMPGTDSKASNAVSGLMQASANGDPPKGSSSVSNTTLQSSVAIYGKICGKERLKMKQAVLADLAYVELCLENPLRALSAAKTLYQLQDCSRLYVFLGRLYAAEALCLLGQPNDAADCLSVYYIKGGNAGLELPYTDEDQEKWKCLVEKDGDGEDSVEVVLKLSSELQSQNQGGSSRSSSSSSSFNLKPGEAQGVIYVNLAVMSAVQGDVEQAYFFVKQGLTSLPDNPRVVLAAVYVDLLLGKTLEALPKLRWCRNTRFVCAT